MARLGPLYGEQFGLFLGNKPPYSLIFNSCGIGRLYGRIFGETCDFSPPCSAGSRSGASSDPRWASVSVWHLFMGGRHRNAPRPPWGTGDARGGLNDIVRIFFCTKSGWSRKFSGISNFHPKKFSRTDVRPEFFWIFQFSNRKKSGRRTFNPKIFAIFKVRAKNFPAREISRPKKVQVFRFHGLYPSGGFTTGK